MILYLQKVRRLHACQIGTSVLFTFVLEFIQTRTLKT